MVIFMDSKEMVIVEQQVICLVEKKDVGTLGENAVGTRTTVDYLVLHLP